MNEKLAKILEGAQLETIAKFYKIDIEHEIEDLMSDADDTGDNTDLEVFLSKYKSHYPDNIYAYAFREAVMQGYVTFIEDHVNDIELNDFYGYCSYLSETDDEEIQSMLLQMGARRSWDSPSKFQFAMDFDTGRVIIFTRAFQKRVFSAYLAKFELTTDNIIDMLGEDADRDAVDEFDSKYDRYFYGETEALGVCVENGEIIYRPVDYLDGLTLFSLIDELGWKCDNGIISIHGVTGSITYLEKL